MTYNAPIPIGTDPWGTLLNDTLFELHRTVGTNPVDHGAVAWTFDNTANSGSSTLTTGTPFMGKVWVREPTTLSTLYVSSTTAGTALTVGQNFAGVYDAAGVRLAITADQTTPWGTTTGLYTMPLTAPIAVTPGAYYLTLLSNGTTSPNLARGSLSGGGPTTVNWGLTATNARYATGPAGQTSLPATITMASRTTSNISLWMAVA